jgi:branched-chain amino acid transport system ATP-binding protein
MPLNEPSLGLAPILIKSIFDTGRKMADQGATVLLAEQGVMHSLGLSERGYVLEHGRIVMEGPADRLLQDPHVKTAYLGLEAVTSFPAFQPITVCLNP